MDNDKHSETPGGSTYERAVLRLRSDPTQGEFVRLCYLDDPLAAAPRFATSAEFAEVCRLLSLAPQNRGTRILDVGSGNGIASFAFASRGCDVVAVEPDQSPIVGAGAMVGLVSTLTAGSITSAPIPIGEYLDQDGGFDIVYMRQVAHHFPELEDCIARCVEFLKPGGILLMTREHVADTPHDVCVFKRTHALTQDGVIEEAYPAARYRKAMLQAGLTSIQEWGPFDSVINIYPTHPDEVREKAGKLMYARFGRAGVSLFNHVSVVRHFALRMLSNLNKTPGRLFTFKGIKGIN